MASRILLHIGQQKSGTTYLQHGLAQRAAEAAALGLHYPVPPARERHVPNHHQRPFYGLLPGEFPYVSEKHAGDARSDWEWLAERVAQQEGTVLLSSEALAFLRPSAVRKVVETLAVEDLEVLVTARDLSRTLTSAWQQNVRSGVIGSLEEFLEVRSRDRARAGKADENDVVASPWRAYGLAGLVQRWGAVVGEENITLVVNGASDPGVLWRRYLEATGMPGLEDLPLPELTVEQAHLGLTWPEAEVLREVSRAGSEAGLTRNASKVLRQAVIERGFLPRPERGSKIGLPEAWLPTLQEWTAEEGAAVRASAITVVGDLDELTPRPSRATPPTAQDVALAGAAAVVAAGQALLVEPPKPKATPAPTPVRKAPPVALTPQQRAVRFARKRVLPKLGQASKQVRARLRR